MSLLFDSNLSHQLVKILADQFPGSIHSRQIDRMAPDEVIWKYAFDHGLAVVSKDADFLEIIQSSRYRGKAIKIDLGNCSTLEVAALLLEREQDIKAFLTDPERQSLTLP